LDEVVGVATRDVFSAEELARLRGFPEITRAELIRYFTLTRADEAFLRKFHRRDNVLGAGVQLASLPWLGFVPDEVASAPVAAVGRLAERLGIPAGELAGYGQRGQTRTEHLREILAYTGWRVLDAPGWKEVDEFLFARAMEHDSAKLADPAPATCRRRWTRWRSCMPPARARSQPGRRRGLCPPGGPATCKRPPSGGM
jgi:Domain of unknown function (DUF4158)